MGELTNHVVTPIYFCDTETASRVRADFGFSEEVCLRGSLIIESLLVLSVIFRTSLSRVPWEFMGEAGFEVTSIALHDRFIITSLVELTGVTIGSKTTGEGWVVFERFH